MLRKQQKQSSLGLMMLSDRMFAPTAVYGGCHRILTAPIPHHPSLIRMAHNAACLNSFNTVLAELTGKEIPVQFGKKQNEQKEWLLQLIQVTCKHQSAYVEKVSL